MATNGKDYPNSGILFKNDRKRDDKAPGYTGHGDVTCPGCGSRFSSWLDAWVKVGRTGAKLFSLSFKPKDSTASRAQADDSDLDRAF